jgi:predicted lactoylglutathione lyase
MSKTLYLNVPVTDTAAARDFYTKAGFTINEEFSNPISETVVINDNVLLLLVNEASFKEAAKRDIADTTKVAETVLALELENRDSVDTLANGAVAAGAEELGDAFEHDGMYTRIFRDPYGHQFNVFTFL